jgi:hypothetical protein
MYPTLEFFHASALQIQALNFLPSAQYAILEKVSMGTSHSFAGQFTVVTEAAYDEWAPTTQFPLPQYSILKHTIPVAALSTVPGSP